MTLQLFFMTAGSNQVRLPGDAFSSVCPVWRACVACLASHAEAAARAGHWRHCQEGYSMHSYAPSSLVHACLPATFITLMVFSLDSMIQSHKRVRLCNLYMFHVVIQPTSSGRCACVTHVPVLHSKQILKMRSRSKVCTSVM